MAKPENLPLEATANHASDTKRTVSAHGLAARDFIRETSRAPCERYRATGFGLDPIR
jgi:hypothetical protein